MDVYLFRSLKNGSQYNSLFSKSTGEIVELGKGDTDYSIDKMVDWILLHQHQTQKISPLLKKSSLEQTCKAIHEFVFWHFQYKADTSDQLLRSPNHAWKNRADGIDCKSYSIIASCILHNLGINHYIRKVAYTTPGEYTHVYVVVPQNQQTNDLNDGFYMIDGTINTMQEPYFLEEKDEYMSGLKHYGLNSPNQLNGDFSIKDFDDVKDLISSIDCIGGSSYTKDKFNKHLVAIEAYFKNLTNKINQAIIDGDDDDFALAVAEFKAHSRLFVLANNEKVKEGWNSCSTKIIKAIITANEFYRDVVGGLLTAWLNDNFVKETQYSTQRVETYETGNLNATIGIYGSDTKKKISTTERAFYYAPKPKQIPKFEINSYVADQSVADFDPIAYLATLTTIAANYLPATTNNGSTPISSGGSYVQDNGLQPTTQTAGGGWAGWILGIAALGFVFTRKSSTTAAKTTARKSSSSKSK